MGSLAPRKPQSSGCDIACAQGPPNQGGDGPAFRDPKEKILPSEATPIGGGDRAIPAFMREKTNPCSEESLAGPRQRAIVLSKSLGQHLELQLCMFPAKSYSLSLPPAPPSPKYPIGLSRKQRPHRKANWTVI